MRRDLDFNRDQIWRWIAAFTKKRGYAPSQQEIADAVGLSVSRVNWYIDVMEARGILSRDRYVPRSIRLLKPAPQGTTLPALSPVPDGPISSSLAGLVADLDATLDALDAVLNRIGYDG